MIRAIIFDLGDVLFKGSMADFLKKAEKAMGKKCRFESPSCLNKNLYLGKTSLRHALEKAFSKNLSDEEFIQVARHWMANWQPDPEMLELAGKLKKKYRLAVLSNSEKSYEEKYDDMLKKIFSVVLYSHRERMVKPDLEFFKLALKKLGTSPEETVMVDDTKENELPCAKLGIHFILFKNIEELEKRLELLGVKTQEPGNKPLKQPAA